ncbi:MAG: rhodanese-related sulfurtransferase [Gammaproteobacteria bacterium]|jgi:rhodanese-related sulfurtransferase
MTLKKNKPHIQEISPPEALVILNSRKQAVLIDVRSKVEYDFVGHPFGAINIPWQEPPLWEIVLDFANQVRSQLIEIRADIPLEEMTVLMLCRSGARSMSAAIELKKNGFTNVINITEGFEGGLDRSRHRGNIGGWRHHNLPWEQT